ncbi:ArsR/SmtB family transcription factor [Cytobacillus solani]|uniref:ArsR/SmtB family transcription factor n=1 Tax=Cytobacillus solani TaxID=1637975 RepID=UPI00115048AD|nr:metalloregulator ArsR/SmtB family transcription factor [Cytobacillus solani]
MSFQVIVDFSPVNELITSLYHYINFKQHRNFSLSKDWHNSVKTELHPHFAAELEDDRLEVLHRINLLVWQCPGERTPKEFIKWLQDQPPGDLYERLAPWINNIPGNLKELRDRMVYLLSEWDVQYFQHIDPRIIEQLKDDARQKRNLISKVSSINLIEEATNGIRIEPNEMLKTVFLIPQYHCRPATILDYFESMCTCLYPVKSAANDANELPWELTFVTHALADENRLKILRFLHSGMQNFSAIQNYIGLAKSTTNHHLSILRRAGLIRTHYFGSKFIHQYSLREEGLEQMQNLINAYIRNNDGGV